MSLKSSPQQRMITGRQKLRERRNLNNKMIKQSMNLRKVMIVTVPIEINYRRENAKRVELNNREIMIETN